VVRFAYEVAVAVADVVLFVVGVLLETSLPELEVVPSGVEAEDCATEGVGEKEGRREKRKRKRE